MIKSLFNKNLHEVIELRGFGDKGIVKLTNVMRSLINYRYCEVVRIKTGTAPGAVLKVSFKKTADFQTSYDAFNVLMTQRREAREAEEAAKKLSDAEAQASAVKADSVEDVKVDSSEAKAEADAT